MKILLFAIAVVGMSGTSAQASFHLWNIQEVYTNSNGTVQFIEFFSAAGSQESLSSRNLASTGASTFVFPANLPLNSPLAGHPNTASSTQNQTFLMGTANLSTLFGVVPDYIIPAGFLTSGSGNVLNFQSGTDSVSLTNLPTGGAQSLNAETSNPAPTAFSINSVATPKNFRGETATIPEPSATLLFLATCVFGLTLRPARRE